MGERFFNRADFAAFERSKARTEDPEVIRTRKHAVTKLKELNRQHTGPFMKARGLYPHPNPDHWTNVFFPKDKANGEWVDYLRMGYGKEGALVKDMAERAGFVKELRGHGTTDHMAFHYVAQVQIGLTSDYWWFNFYIDDKAWLEQANLLEKIQQPAHRRTCISLLDDLMEAGYDLRIWSSQESGISVHARESPEEFISDLALYRRDRLSVNVDIERRFDPHDPENDANLIVGVAKREFETLLPLYRFSAWHPTSNHFVKRL